MKRAPLSNYNATIVTASFGDVDFRALSMGCPVPDEPPLHVAGDMMILPFTDGEPFFFFSEDGAKVLVYQRTSGSSPLDLSLSPEISDPGHPRFGRICEGFWEPLDAVSAGLK